MKRQMRIAAAFLALLATVAGGAFAQTLNEQLLIAASKGDVPAVDRLIKGGANVNAKDTDGWTALMYAAGNGHSDVVRLLIQNNAGVNAKANDSTTALMYAAALGHSDAAQLLIQSHADVNAKDNIGLTPLIFAAGNGHTAVVRLLIKRGADVNARDGTGTTALMYATAFGHTDVEQVLQNASSEVVSDWNTVKRHPGDYKEKLVSVTAKYKEIESSKSLELLLNGVPVKNSFERELVGKITRLREGRTYTFFGYVTVVQGEPCLSIVDVE